MALTQVNGGMLDSVAQQVGFRNRIINGAMMIDQRNAGAAVTNVTSAYVTDRWKGAGSTDGAVTIQQSTTAPAGFTNSTKLLVATADTSIGAAQYYQFLQPIEGYNVADFGLGASGASSFTVSFWVNSSKTGTYCATLANSAANRLCPVSFTVNSANTWEYKTLTVAGDITGTWLTTNGIGLYLIINLALGSNFNAGTSGTWNTTQYGTSSQVNWLDTLGATFYITGVQLEKGSTATSFDYRPYGTELALCQRYLPCFTAQSGTVGPLPGMATALTTNVQFIFNHPVPARVPGTGVGYSANTHFNFSNNDGNSSSTAVAFAASSPSASQVTITVAVSRGATTTPGWIYANNANAVLYITGCEL